LVLFIYLCCIGSKLGCKWSGQYLHEIQEVAMEKRR
jgi:hypothetical protein